MTQYAKGTRKEREAMHMLQRAGYRCVRSAGSHGSWDIVAVNSKELRLIQVKYKGTKVSTTDILRDTYMLFDELDQIPIFASVELWVKERGKPTQPFTVVKVVRKGEMEYEVTDGFKDGSFTEADNENIQQRLASWYSKKTTALTS